MAEEKNVVEEAVSEEAAPDPRDWEIEKLKAEVEKLKESSPNRLQRAKVLSEFVQTTGDLRKRREEWLGSDAPPRFAPDDLVRYAAGSDESVGALKFLVKEGALVEGDAQPAGIVLGFEGESRQGENRYTVRFPGIGSDVVVEACLEFA